MYIILLTFALLGEIEEKTLQCPTMECVNYVRYYQHESPSLIRFRVWKKEDYARLIGGFVWPPIIDDIRG